MDSSTTNNLSGNDPNVTAEASQTNILNKSFSQYTNSAARVRRTPMLRPRIDESVLERHLIPDLQKAIEEADNEPICFAPIREQETDPEPELPTSELDTTLPLVDNSALSDDLGSSWLFSDTPVKMRLNIQPVPPLSKPLVQKLFQTPKLPYKQMYVTPRSQVKDLKEVSSSINAKSETPSNKNTMVKLATPINAIATPHNKQLMELNPKIVFSNTKSNIQSLQNVQVPKLKPVHEVLNPVVNKENYSNQKQLTLQTNQSLNAANCHAGFNSNKVITVNNKAYMILHELGKGGSSIVYSCYDKEQRECAIKKVNLNIDSSMISGYINEVQMLKKLQNYDRIIKMFDFEIKGSSKELLVVLEKGSIDLHRILKISCAKSTQLPVYRIIFYWMEMLYAVKQIHENGIIHSDLKPANFLMAEGHLKLIDFGIASCVVGDNTSVLKDITVGSFNYISPEALQDSKQNSTGSPTGHQPKYKINYKSDVWSLGCILYELVYRRTPFHGIGHVYAKLAAILDPRHQIQFPPAPGVPDSIIAAIKMCLQHEPKARPAVDDLINLYPYL